MEKNPDQEDITVDQNPIVKPPSKQAATIANDINNAINLITNTKELNIPAFSYQKLNIEPNQIINLTYPDLGGCYTISIAAKNSTGQKILICIHQPLLETVESNLRELTNNENLAEIQATICVPEHSENLISKINEILNHKTPIPMTEIIYHRKVQNPNNPKKKMPAKAILNVIIDHNQKPKINFIGSNYTTT